MSRTKTRAGKPKLHPNAKVKKTSSYARQRQAEKKQQHVKKQKRAAVELVQLIEGLVKQAPSAEHILRKLTTSSFPLIRPFDLERYRSRVAAWLPGKGAAGMIPSQFRAFMELLEKQAPAYTLDSWAAARRILAANGQATGTFKAVLYYGYVIAYDADIAFPIPHCWISLEQWHEGAVKRILIDPSLSDTNAGSLVSTLMGETELILDKAHSQNYVAGRTPYQTIYVGAPADAESAEATILWWAQAVVDDQKSKGVELPAPESYSMPGIIQFIRTLTQKAGAADINTQKAGEADNGEAVSEEPAGDVQGDAVADDGR